MIPFNLTMRKLGLLLSATTTLSLVAASPASAYTIFQSEGGSTVPFAAGSVAEASFVSALGMPPVVDTLNGLTPGVLTGKTIFSGLTTGTLSQPASSTMSILTAGDCYGGSQCIYGYPNVNPAFDISFSSPVAGFGFWANDQNTVGDQITILINGVTTLGPSASFAQASFYGFIASNPSEYISTLSFQSSNARGGILAFDQFTTAAPGPLPVAGAAAAFGFSRKLRNRIKTARAV